MKLASLVILLSLLASCNRHAMKGRSTETSHLQQAIKTVDTSKQTYVTKTTQTLTYGDTLSGSLYFPDFSAVNQNQQLSDTTGVMPVVEDSLESDGIKIKVGIMPYKGGFKTHIIASSKPVSVVNTTETNQQAQAGKSQDIHSSGDTTLATKQSDIHTDSIWMVGVCVLLLIVLAYLTYKYYLHGKKIS